MYGNNQIDFKKTKLCFPEMHIRKSVTNKIHENHHKNQVVGSI